MHLSASAPPTEQAAARSPWEMSMGTAKPWTIVSNLYLVWGFCGGATVLGRSLLLHAVLLKRRFLLESRNPAVVPGYDHYVFLQACTNSVSVATKSRGAIWNVAGFLPRRGTTYRLGHTVVRWKGLQDSYLV